MHNKLLIEILTVLALTAIGLGAGFFIILGWLSRSSRLYGIWMCGLAEVVCPKTD